MLSAVCCMLFLSVTTVEIQASDDDLFNFTSGDLGSWKEISDIVRKPGMSKGVLSLQRTRVYQRAVMFAMINPQPNGAGFAGVQTTIPSSAASHASSTGLRLKVRGQGQLKYWKVVLTDQSQVGSMKRLDYEMKFKVETDMSVCNRQFEIVELPFSDFKAYERGKEVKDAPPLDLTKTGVFGFQAFGGVYDSYKQEGTGSLEIDYVSFY